MEDFEAGLVERCSFCGSGKGQVPFLIAGIDGFVCEPCIGHLQGMLIERSWAAVPLRILGVTLTKPEHEYRLLNALFPAGAAAALFYRTVLSNPQDQLVRWTGSFVLLLALFLAACFVMFAFSEMERHSKVLGRIFLALAWLASGTVVGASFGFSGAAIGGVLSVAIWLVIVTAVKPPPPKLWRPGPSRVQ